MIFVTGRTTRAIEDHFETAYELENELALQDRTAMLKSMGQIVQSTSTAIKSYNPSHERMPTMLLGLLTAYTMADTHSYLGGDRYRSGAA